MNSQNTDPSVLEHGVLFALDRDRSKSLFGARGDGALRDFVSSLSVESSMWDEKLAVDCQGNWKVIDEGLGKIEAQLQQCLLGGRPMYHGSEMTVNLIRPDLVPHLADALDAIDDGALRESLSADLDLDDVHATIIQIRQLYRSAAEQRSAIVFAVQH